MHEGQQWFTFVFTTSIQLKGQVAGRLPANEAAHHFHQHLALCAVQQLQASEYGRHWSWTHMVVVHMTFGLTNNLVKAREKYLKETGWVYLMR